MRTRSTLPLTLLDLVSLLVAAIVFIVPFIFIVLTASKTSAEAAKFAFTLPSDFRLFQNLWEVIQFRDYRMLLALWNSTLLTVGSVVLIVILSGVWRSSCKAPRPRFRVANWLCCRGSSFARRCSYHFRVARNRLIQTLIGLISLRSRCSTFCHLITPRVYVIDSRELDEAAILDGASPWQLFLNVILPLLRPAIISIVVVTAVVIYNDFTLPLYFLPGSENVTAQLTLFSFISQFTSRFNLLFANVVIITIPPLIMYIFFQRQIVAGMTSGAVKG